MLGCIRISITKLKEAFVALVKKLYAVKSSIFPPIVYYNSWNNIPILNLSSFDAFLSCILAPSYTLFATVLKNKVDSKRAPWHMLKFCYGVIIRNFIFRPIPMIRLIFRLWYSLNSPYFSQTSWNRYIFYFTLGKRYSWYSWRIFIVRIFNKLRSYVDNWLVLTYDLSSLFQYVSNFSNCILNCFFSHLDCLLVLSNNFLSFLLCFSQMLVNWGTSLSNFFDIFRFPL